MHAWKFLAPESGVLGSDDVFYRGYVSVVIASSAQEARERLLVYAVMNDLDTGWIDVVEPERITIDKPSILCWAQV